MESIGDVNGAMEKEFASDKGIIMKASFEKKGVDLLDGLQGPALT